MRGDARLLALLRRSGQLTRAQARSVLKAQQTAVSQGQKCPLIGEVLVQSGYVSRERLEQVLWEQAERRGGEGIPSGKSVILLRRRWAHPLEAVMAVCTLAAAFLASSTALFLFETRLTTAAIASFAAAFVVYPSLLLLAVRVAKSPLCAVQRPFPGKAVHSADGSAASTPRAEAKASESPITLDPRQHALQLMVWVEALRREADPVAGKTRMRRFLEFLHLPLRRKTHRIAKRCVEATLSKEEDKDFFMLVKKKAALFARDALDRPAAVKMLDAAYRQRSIEEDFLEAVKRHIKALAKRDPEILDQSERLIQVIEELRLERGVSVQGIGDEPSASGPGSAENDRDNGT